ncbi:MAG: hypothetical protein V4651_13270 [Bacteroidota bacterium]
MKIPSIQLKYISVKDILVKRRLFFLSILVFLVSCGPHKKQDKNPSTDVSVDTQSTKQITEANRAGSNFGYDNQVSSLGIGLVIAPTVFEVFNDSLLKNKLVDYNMYSEDESDIGFCSKFYKPDYGIMHFVCVGKTTNAYKILINYSEIKYLPNTQKYAFETWDQYIMGSFGIKRLTDDSGDHSKILPLRTTPFDNATTVTIPEGYELFCPISVKGDWVHVQYDCFYNDENNTHVDEPCSNYIDKCKHPLTGWLKWREGNKILIGIFLMP